MRFVLVLLAMLASSLALGQALPSPQVLTRPANDNSPRAASTAYVDGSIQTLLNALDARTFGRLAVSGRTMIGEAGALADLGVYSTAPASGWKGRQFTARVAPTPHTGFSFVGDAVTVDALGSTKNGPNSATYGRSSSVIKRGFPLTTATSGEIDGDTVIVRQSGPTPTTFDGSSDAAGVLYNVQMAGDPGFIAGIEGTSSRINPTNPFATTRAMQFQIGTIDAFGGNPAANRFAPGVNYASYGYTAVASTGDLTTALYALNAGGTWANFLRFDGGLAGGPVLRAIGGTGQDAGGLKFGPDGGSFTLSRDAGNNLIFVDTAGATKLQVFQNGGLSSSGTVTAAALSLPAWTPYTPTVTSQGGAFGALGAIEARYQLQGKTLHLNVDITVPPDELGTATGGVRFTMPAGLTARGVAILAGREIVATGLAANGSTSPGGNTVFVFRGHDNAMPVVSNSRLVVSGTIEIN